MLFLKKDWKETHQNVHCGFLWIVGLWMTISEQCTNSVEKYTDRVEYKCYWQMRNLKRQELHCYYFYQNQDKSDYFICYGKWHNILPTTVACEIRNHSTPGKGILILDSTLKWCTGAIPWQSRGQDSALPLQGAWVWSQSHMPLSAAKLNKSIKGAWGIPVPIDRARQHSIPQNTQRASNRSPSWIALCWGGAGVAVQEGKLRNWTEMASI